MRCAKVDDQSINIAMLILGDTPPQDLAIELLRLSGQVRRGEVVDGATVVALLKSAAAFLE